VVVESARAARSDDAAVVAWLAARARAELAGERGGGLLVLHDLPPAGTVPDGADVLVGCLDDVVVGYAVLRIELLRDGSRLGVVDELYVEPEARGVGVGEAVMELVVARCRAAGCRGVDAVALPGMRETKNFFESFGLVARAIVVHRSLTA
jgi:GNAT superfamily N-acetyltransferase